MTLALTFADKKLLDTAVIGPDGAVHYTTTTTSGLRGRKITTVGAASGIIGFINWRDKTFVINGVPRSWDDLKSRSGGLFSSEREWNWANRPFKLQYHDSHQELLATPLAGNIADTVRFTTSHPHLFHDNDRAMIYFPYQMQDEIERMFILMAVLHTETHRQDEQARVARNAAITSSTAS
ncbi:hypothetical protein R3P38DRAFT_2906548 [Favolaschia claudopus]|uniref:Peptidase S74 domain-containing protein n=1 Tax=Favolaschia claudopus TaxID=2862362 RepID=A0AAW0CK44_9AGAR